MATLEALYTASAPAKRDMTLLRNRRAAAGNVKTEDVAPHVRAWPYPWPPWAGWGHSGLRRGLFDAERRVLCRAAITDGCPGVPSRCWTLVRPVGAVGELHDAARLMAFFEAQLKQQGSSSAGQQQQHQQQQQQGLAFSRTSRTTGTKGWPSCLVPPDNTLQRSRTLPTGEHRADAVQGT